MEIVIELKRLKRLIIGDQMSHKYCSRCKTFVSTTDWYKDKRAKNGLQSYCRSCVKQYNADKNYYKNHYTKNKNILNAKKIISNKERKNKLLEFFISYLNSHPCVDCGESNIIVLEFDHLSDKSRGRRLAKHPQHIPWAQNYSA